MSHIVKMTTKITSVEGLTRACQQLGLAPPTKQGSNSRAAKIANGLEFHIKKSNVQENGKNKTDWITKDWVYPVLVNMDTGELQYDNYENHWGEQKDLDKFVQWYTIEEAKRLAEEQFYYQTGEVETLENGNLRVVLESSY